MRDGPSHYSYRQWAACPRCGLNYPVRELRRDFKGKKVCPDCWDQKGFNEYRAEVSLSIEEWQETDTMEDIL